MLMRIQSVVIPCSDLERSVVFYRDRLGFPVKRRDKDQVELHCGPISLVLLPTDSAQKPLPSAAAPNLSAGPGRARLSFEVLDLDAFHAEKTEAGIEFTLPPTVPANGLARKRAVLLDPDGLHINITQAR